MWEFCPSKPLWKAAPALRPRHLFCVHSHWDLPVLLLLSFPAAFSLWGSVPSHLCSQKPEPSALLLLSWLGQVLPDFLLSFRVLRHANRGPRGSCSSCKLILLMLLLWVMMGPWEGSFAHSRFSVYSPCICANHSVLCDLPLQSALGLKDKSFRIFVHFLLQH